MMEERIAQEILKCMKYAENLCRYTDDHNYLYASLAAAEVLQSGIDFVKTTIDDHKVAEIRAKATEEEVQP